MAVKYTTRKDIEKRLGAEFLSDRLADGVEPGDAIDSAIEDASRLIDAHLSAQYKLPFKTLPNVLIKPATDIVMYMLANDHATLTTTIEDRYDKAIELIIRMAEGKAGLGVDEPRIETTDIETAGHASSEGAYFKANPKLFGRHLP